MHELRDDIALEKRLTDAACPYGQGSVDSVIWLLGYRAGLIRALETICAGLDRPVPKLIASDPAPTERVQ